MVAVVAAEASRRWIVPRRAVPHAVGIGSPGHLHLGEDIALVDGDQSPGGGVHLSALARPHGRVLRAVEVVQPGGDLCGSLRLRGVLRLNHLQPLLVDKGKAGAGCAIHHHLVDGVLGCLEGVGRLVMAVHAVHPAGDARDRPLPVGAYILRGRSVRIVLADRDDRLEGGVGGHILVVVEMVAVDAAEVGERVHSAQMQRQHGARDGVLLVVAVHRLHQQLLAHEARRRMAGLAGGSRRAQHGERSEDGTRIVAQRHLRQLLRPVHLGLHRGGESCADVALHAGHMRVRRDLVCGPLRGHHMAALAAEVRRIHVGDGAIAGRAHNDEVDERGHDDNLDPAPEDRVLEVDLGIDGRDLTERLEMPAPQPDADGNQDQPKDEQTRQKHIEENAQVGIGGAAASKETDDPETDQHNGRRAGDCAADQAGPVVAIKQDQPKALPQLFEIEHADL